MPVPPHVFQLDAAELRYGSFPRRNGGLGIGPLLRAGIAADTFGNGPLGGPLREASALDRALDEILTGAGGGVTEASLVVPDRWLRLLFVEMEEVPRRSREEVLRWKLKGLVPFRVEDLRLQGIEVGAGDAGEPTKVLLAFAVDQLLGEVEDAFGRHGVRIGQIASRSLSLMTRLAERGDGVIVVQVEEAGYSTFFLSAHRPVLFRYRAVALDPWSAATEDDVRRDFRIIKSFLDESLPGVRFGAALLCAPEAAEAGWSRLVEGCFGAPARCLGGDDFAVSEVPGDVGWSWLAPMVAAASREIR